MAIYVPFFASADVAGYKSLQYFDLPAEQVVVKLNRIRGTIQIQTSL